MDLPPGFRFHPTDEEIITHYLTPKILNHGFTAPAMGAVDLNKCEPWDLPGKAKIDGGEKEWYFFCQRDRKYPTGMRTNRATESGYWKATGKDREICSTGGRGVLVGMKKTLVFYAGRAPKGQKTNWVMHEFRIEGRSSSQYLSNLPKKDEWVVCRVFHKNGSPMRGVMTAEEDVAQPPLLTDPLDIFFPAGDDSFEEIFTMANNYSCSFDHDDMINYAMAPPPGEMSCLSQDWRLGTQSAAVPGRRCKAEQLSYDDVFSN